MFLPLEKRWGYSNCYTQYDGNVVCDNSTWNDWARWVVLAAIVLFVIFVFITCSCLSARRRRRAGQQPFYGTGWANRDFHPHHGHHNNPQGGQWQQPAPPYSAQPAPPPDYNAQSQHTGYYGQGNGGIELQSPGGAYHQPGRERDEGYMPPEGPPPGKKADVVVR